jgi:hypothetical protein
MSSTRKKHVSGGSAGVGSKVPVPLRERTTPSPSAAPVTVKDDDEDVSIIGVVKTRTLRSTTAKGTASAWKEPHCDPLPATKKFKAGEKSPSFSRVRSSPELYGRRPASPSRVISDSSSKRMAMSPSRLTPTTNSQGKRPMSPSRTTPVTSRNPFVQSNIRANSNVGLGQIKKLQAAAKLAPAVAASKGKDLATMASTKAKVIKFQGTSWVERNYPTSTDELFVHKKKVEEVQAWLKGALGIEKNIFQKVRMRKLQINVK